MTPREVEDIRGKYDKLKSQASKAEGAKEQLLSTLLTEFSLKDTDEATSHLSKLDKRITNLDSELDELGDEINGMADWSKL